MKASELQHLLHITWPKVSIQEAAVKCDRTKEGSAQHVDQQHGETSCFENGIEGFLYSHLHMLEVRLHLHVSTSK